MVQPILVAQIVGVESGQKRRVVVRGEGAQLRGHAKREGARDARTRRARNCAIRIREGRGTHAQVGHDVLTAAADFLLRRAGREQVERAMCSRVPSDADSTLGQPPKCRPIEQREHWNPSSGARAPSVIAADVPAHDEQRTRKSKLLKNRRTMLGEVGKTVVERDGDRVARGIDSASHFIPQLLQWQDANATRTEPAHMARKRGR